MSKYGSEDAVRDFLREQRAEVLGFWLDSIQKQARKKCNNDPSLRIYAIGSEIKLELTKEQKQWVIEAIEDLQEILLPGEASQRALLAKIMQFVKGENP